MKVELLPLAEQHLENIYDFYYNKSENAAISIYNDILDEIERLESFKEIVTTLSIYQCKSGDIYFSHLVNSRKNYKIIYFMNLETIYVSAIWDCRRNPKALKELLERE